MTTAAWMLLGFAAWVAAAWLVSLALGARIGRAERRERPGLPR